MSTSAEGRPTGRTGRPVDRSRDDEALAVALDALAERGYDQVTLDEIARRTGRAKTTLYRRWASKEALVLAAIAAAGRPPELDGLPDEGSLRADLLAVIDSPWLGGPARRAAIFAGATSAAAGSPALADAVRTRITEPYEEVYRALLSRAAARGELRPVADATIALIARVIPALSDHRLRAGREAIDRAFFASIVDEIVLPALRPGPRAPDAPPAQTTPVDQSAQATSSG